MSEQNFIMMQINSKTRRLENDFSSLGLVPLQFIIIIMVGWGGVVEVYLWHFL